VRAGGREEVEERFEGEEEKEEEKTKIESNAKKELYITGF